MTWIAANHTDNKISHHIRKETKVNTEDSQRRTSPAFRNKHAYLTECQDKTLVIGHDTFLNVMCLNRNQLCWMMKDCIHTWNAQLNRLFTPGGPCGPRVTCRPVLNAAQLSEKIQFYLTLLSCWQLLRTCELDQCVHLGQSLTTKRKNEPFC